MPTFTRCSTTSQMSMSTSCPPISETLPPEVIVRVLHWLDFRSLLRCQQVCRSWRDLIQDTAELQYSIERAVHQVQDCCPSTMSLDERLHALRRAQAAWRTLALGAPVPLLTTLERQVHFTGEVVSYRRAEDSAVCFKQLGPGLAYARDMDTTLASPGGEVMSFVDPLQDLLITVPSVEAEGPPRIRVWSLSADAPHPLAAQAEIVVDVSPLTAVETANIVVRGDTVAVQCMNTRPEDDLPRYVCIVYDWKTGRMHMCMPLSNVFDLVDGAHALLVTGTQRDALRYARPRPNGLMIFDFTAQTELPISAEDAQGSCTFMLPAFCAAATTCDASNAHPQTISRASPAAARTRASLFPPDADADRLMVLDLIVEVTWHGWKGLRLLVSTAALLHAFRARSRTAPRVVLWDEWRDCVRWAADVPDFAPCRDQCVAGMRFVGPRACVLDDGRLEFCVRDFNARRIARAEARGLGPDEDVEQSSSACGGDIVAKHPCLVRTVVLPAGTTRRGFSVPVLVTEEGLFLAEEDPEEGDKEIKVWMLPFSDI